MGLDDFAGTGYFSREYLVSTINYKNFIISGGIGWGQFAADNSFENPLSYIKDSFKTRSSYGSSLGGKPSYDLWFRGNASLFGGIEYIIPRSKGLKLKIEKDPFNYLDFGAKFRRDANAELRRKDSDINYGLNYPINDFFSLELSYIKGNTFNLSFNSCFISL